MEYYNYRWSDYNSNKNAFLAVSHTASVFIARLLQKLPLFRVVVKYGDSYKSLNHATYYHHYNSSFSVIFVSAVTFEQEIQTCLNYDHVCI